jgi:hypothetical protein
VSTQRGATKILTLFFLHFFTRKTSLAIASSLPWCLAAMDLGSDMPAPFFPRNLLHEAFWSQAVLIIVYTTLFSTLAHARYVALGFHSIASLGIDVFGAVLPIFLPIVFEISCFSRFARFLFLLETV